MESQLTSISKLFTDRLYRIPDYQRGYSWSTKQLEDFWTDLFLLEHGKNHYAGVLTFEKIAGSITDTWIHDQWIIKAKSFEPYFIVDGQQRITTIVILIQAILETKPPNATLNFTPLNEIRKRYIFDSKDNGVSKSYILGYHKDNSSYEFLKTKIFLESSDSNYLKEETIYTYNLNNAKEFFKQKLSKLRKKDVEEIFRKVTQSFLFNVYSTGSEIEVHTTFEVMNNRGKPLSNLELLKNRLIYLSTKLFIERNDSRILREKINNSLKAIYYFLGKNRNNVLKDDDFLMNHFLGYFGIHINIVEPEVNLSTAHKLKNCLRETYEYFLFDSKFNIKNIHYDKRDKVFYLEISKYVESLQKSIGFWHLIHNPTYNKDYSDEEILLLEKLNRLGIENFNSLLLICYLKEKSEELRVIFLKTLERFSFISLLRQTGKTSPLWQMQVFAFLIATGKMTLEEVEKVLSNQILLTISSDAFGQGLAKKFAEETFYKWAGIRYFLYEYEIFLFNTSKTKKKKIDWAEYILEKEDYSSIEHIYPQNPKNKWGEEFDSLSVQHKKIVCNSLGNLLPLSRAKNSSLQNGSFKKKKDNGSNSVGYAYGSYSENEICKHDFWSPLLILQRGLKLLDFMEKRWSIKLGDLPTKIDILNLDALVKAYYQENYNMEKVIKATL